MNASKTLTVSIPHRLCKEEAVRRIRSGLTNVANNFGRVLSVEKEVWVADQLTFSVRSLGQVAQGKIDVAEDHVRLEVALPWLLGILAEKLAPMIRKEGAVQFDRASDDGEFRDRLRHFAPFLSGFDLKASGLRLAGGAVSALLMRSIEDLEQLKEAAFHDFDLFLVGHQSDEGALRAIRGHLRRA